MNVQSFFAFHDIIQVIIFGGQWEMPLIQIQDLTYEYDDFKLGPLNLELDKDQWISIIGRNGSGKSTLARLIDGLIEAQSGTITVNGLEVNEQNVWQIRSQIGVVFQNPDNQLLGPLNLELDKDQWISIIGRNGSGKSTLARLIDGLIEAQSGTITVDGLEVNERNVWQIRSQIGVVFQNPDNQFVGASVLFFKIPIINLWAQTWKMMWLSV